jgi:hypothetical protein
MRGAIPPIHQYTFMAWCLVKHRDNFTFTFRIVNTYVVLTSDLGNQIKEKEMGGTCSMAGSMRNAYKILVGKPEGKRPPRRLRRR